MLKKFKFLILLTIIVHSLLFADITVKSKIDTALATVGDQITLRLSVIYENEKTNISFPDINDELQNFTLVSRNSGKPEKISTGFQQDFDFKIAVFDTGRTEIPAITVKTQTDTAAPLIFETAKHTINVISILPPDENVEPKDIKPPFPLPTVIPWDIVIFILILLAIAAAWYLWYKKWKRAHPVVSFDETYTDPAHVIALQKLQAIKKYPFTTEQEIIKTYTEISYVFREYLEGRFFIPALEMPTRDILESRQFMQLDDEISNQTETILQELDIIKFANQLPAPREKERIIKTAETIINQTKIDSFLSQRSGLTEARESLKK